MQEIYLIYDIGKTNKKVLVFSADGKVIDEYKESFEETTDEDGFPCDDLEKITDWVLGQHELLLKNGRYKIKAINFATYGASFVHINEAGKPLTPLYNYLKPFPASLKQKFLTDHFNSDANEFSLHTGSPFMGMLNSGLQLYWLKQTNPQVWNSIKYSLHLPQYLSYLFTNKPLSDYTSVGCHTGLWNMKSNQYHPWIFAEEINQKLAPLTNTPVAGEKKGIAIGVGLHDSSAALIPYLNQNKEPFLLISTGTWCINLNPFNHELLTPEELKKDCLCYLQVTGKQVKASRIFLGKEHDYQTKRIAAHFNVPEDFYKSVTAITIQENNHFIPSCMEGSGPLQEKQIGEWDVSIYKNAETAYIALMKGLTDLLKISIDLVLTPDIKQIFIDGGFAANQLFKRMLMENYPAINISKVEFSQATAFGAYLQIRNAHDAKT